jgi:heat shock protein HslJ
VKDEAMQFARLLIIFLALSGCSPKEESQSLPTNAVASAGVRNDATVIAIDPAQMIGNWRIVAINGVAPQNTNNAAKLDDTNHRVAHMKFRATNFGGNTGCNYFGGLAVMRGNRYFTFLGPMTVMACAKIDAQENAIIEVMRQAPLVGFEPSGAMVLSANGTSIEFAKDTLSSPAKTEPVAPSLTSLAGTSWDIFTTDGRILTKRTAPKPRAFTFEADRWSADLACGTMKGAWAQRGNIIAATGEAAKSSGSCAPDDVALDAVIVDVIKANPSFVSDVENIIIAAGDHWLIARNRRVMANEANLLTGHWRIATIDGKPPQSLTPQSDPPRLSFDGTRYLGSSGCNSLNGYFLAHYRRIFTLGTPQTEMGCGALTGQENRINTLLAASPRVAKLASGGVALIDKDGQMELVRDTTKIGVLTPSRVTSLSPRVGRIELYSVDGELVRPLYMNPERFLSFAGQKWTSNLGCDGLAGVWRVDAVGFAFFTDGPKFEAPPCPPERQIWNDRLSTILNGQSRVLIGTNGEFLLAAGDHWIVGQTARN